MDCRALQHGLVRGSFVPPTPIRQLRDLTRLRASLRQDHTAIANRMQKRFCRKFSLEGCSAMLLH